MRVSRNRLDLVTFLVQFHIALWERFGPFSDILGIRWDFFFGAPAIYFADFGAILATFDHFWAIFGPFLGRKKKLAFFAEKWHFGPEISAES